MFFQYSVNGGRRPALNLSYEVAIGVTNRAFIFLLETSS